MSIELSREIWNELRRYINTVDRDEAAETLVSVLIDNDADADEIKTVFKTEPDIKRALTSYLKNHEDDDEDDEALHEDDEDDYDDNY
jgi:hypothetical protein